MGKRPTESIRFGARLEDGCAHDMDHAAWTRRQFLKGMGLAAAGASVTLAGTPVQAFAHSSLLSNIASGGTNRILVIIQLFGGNDGLNTIVPISNDLYYNARPAIAIPPSSTIQITSDIGFHPSFATIESLYGDGNMAIAQGVGYPSPNLSHFRSTDVWLSASPIDDIADTGWSGRHLDALYPGFTESPPDSPLAVQIGSGSPLLFQGPEAHMGMSLFSVELFDRLAETGKFYDETDIPDTAQGNEIGFVRSVANDSFRYAGSIQRASESGQNDVEYPTAGSLAEKMAIVAQLIKGRLGTNIYHVNLGGFDTHAVQLGRHATLLTYLAEAVDAFYRDIAASGLEEEVLIMTFSEFGRRVDQNGSGGTDHGTAAPMFLFGAGVNGGLYGQMPSLSNLDRAKNMVFSTDFRSVYGSVLTDWFGLASTDVSNVLGGDYPLLPFISDPTAVGREVANIPSRFELDQNYPNPFNPSTRISFSIAVSGDVRLVVYDLMGRQVAELVNTFLASGRHEITFEARGLASGSYVYRLDTPGGNTSRQMTLTR